MGRKRREKNEDESEVEVNEPVTDYGELEKKHLGDYDAQTGIYADAPKERKPEVTTESKFGSHKSMVVRELEDGHVVCKDELGEYITTKIYLDNGQADPNRFNATRHK